VKHIRVPIRTLSGLHRLLLTFLTAFLVIIGLVAMHTLASGLNAEHRETPNTAAERSATSMENSTASMLDAATGVSPEAWAAHCAGDCDGRFSGMPNHSMLTVACALALLSVLVLLLAPMLLGRVGAALSLLRLHGHSVLAALPHPRPPSLIVLSISRT